YEIETWLEFRRVLFRSRPVEGLLHDVGGELRVAVLHDRQAHAVDGDGVTEGGVGEHLARTDRQTQGVLLGFQLVDAADLLNQSRSEERRVGKEGRATGA